MKQYTIKEICKMVLTISILLASPCKCPKVINVCYKSWSHCLFTHGSYYGSPCLALSQAYCSKLDPSSYPIELIDERSKNHIYEFLEEKLPNYPVILNAYHVTGQTYIWAQGNAEADVNIQEKYGNDSKCESRVVTEGRKMRCAEPNEEFATVCMKKCPAIWNTHQDHYECTLLTSKYSLKECKGLCEREMGCKGVMFGNFKCCLVKELRTDNKENDMTGYMINYNFEACISKVTEQKQVRIVGNCYFIVSNEVAVILPSILLGILTILCTCKTLCRNPRCRWVRSMNTVTRRVKTRLTVLDYQNARLKSMKMEQEADLENVARLSLELENRRKNSKFIDQIKVYQKGRGTLEAELDKQNIEQIKRKINEARV